MSTAVPEPVKTQVERLARLGAQQVISKRMADRDTIKGDPSWLMLQDDDEDWQAVFFYDYDAEKLEKIRAVHQSINFQRLNDDEQWKRYAKLSKLIDEMPDTGAWTVNALCDYKRLSVDVIAPKRSGKVCYVYSIKHDPGEEVAMAYDTLKCGEMNDACSACISM
jgi:hypothetical protein